MTKNTNGIMTPQPSYTALDALEEKQQKLLEGENVRIRFPRCISQLTPCNLTPHCTDRVDLRNQIIFPIDSDETKDRDDALSISFDGGVYHLGVHIADVAAYVSPNSLLDREAMERGTSIYLPTLTVPMLPSLLSDDLCSLCCEDRYTISTLMNIDAEGNLLSYRIVKSIIHPIVVGVYSEVNQVLSGNSSPEITRKYSRVNDSLTLLHQLANILQNRRRAIGSEIANDFGPADIHFIDGRVELSPRRMGAAEMIVEEMMILCNACCADYFRTHQLPAIFRTQRTTNTRAEYHTNLSYHASLSMDYAHTTSPIRRLADLRMQQILTAHLAGCNLDSIHYLFDALLEETCEVATKRYRRARGIQKACNKFCYREYFKHHAATRYSGVVRGFGRNNVVYIRLNDLNIDVCGFDTKLCLGEEISMKIDTSRPGSNLIAYALKAA